MINNHKIKYFAVVDNNDGYFNGSKDYETANDELIDRRLMAREKGDDPADIILVAVLDV